MFQFHMYCNGTFAAINTFNPVKPDIWNLFYWTFTQNLIKKFLSLRLMICLAQIVWFTENKEEKQLKFIQNEQKYGFCWRCLYLYACE